MPSQKTSPFSPGPVAIGGDPYGDEAFRASLAPYHDEHVRDKYWHAGCPQCAAEEVAQAEAKATKAAARRAKHRT